MPATTRKAGGDDGSHEDWGRGGLREHLGAAQEAKRKAAASRYRWRSEEAEGAPLVVSAAAVVGRESCCIAAEFSPAERAPRDSAGLETGA